MHASAQAPACSASKKGPHNKALASAKLAAARTEKRFASAAINAASQQGLMGASLEQASLATAQQPCTFHASVSGARTLASRRITISGVGYRIAYAPHTSSVVSRSDCAGSILHLYLGAATPFEVRIPANITRVEIKKSGVEADIFGS